MVQPTSQSVSAPGTDPFLEKSGECVSVYKQLLGGRFQFSSNSRDLLDLVEVAYAGLPHHQLSSVIPDFQIELRLLPRRKMRNVAEPPSVKLQSGSGLLCGVMDASNYAILMPEHRRALVVASADMLDHPYHLRYELIEFTVFTLATRGLGLVPLHGGCVGRAGQGILLLGASGSGKSTLALHSLLRGLDFLSEDAVFVNPGNGLATGISNFLHVQADAMRLIDNEDDRRWISHAPVIRRRSGVQKFEVDLRQGRGRLANGPLALAGAVLVSSEQADDASALLSPIPTASIASRLVYDQPYASRQSGWQGFEQRLMQMGVYELRRGHHPQASVDALLSLLDR